MVKKEKQEQRETRRLTQFACVRIISLKLSVLPISTSVHSEIQEQKNENRRNRHVLRRLSECELEVLGFRKGQSTSVDSHRRLSIVQSWSDLSGFRGSKFWEQTKDCLQTSNSHEYLYPCNTSIWVRLPTAPLPYFQFADVTRGIRSSGSIDASSTGITDKTPAGSSQSVRRSSNGLAR